MKEQDYPTRNERIPIAKFPIDPNGPLIFIGVRPLDASYQALELPGLPVPMGIQRMVLRGKFCPA